jgi:hypothetical protein
MSNQKEIQEMDDETICDINGEMIKESSDTDSETEDIQENKRFRLKEKDRIEIITEYIKTGKSRNGFYVKETPGKTFQVRREKNKDERLMIQKQINKLKSQIEMLEAKLNTL